MNSQSFFIAIAITLVSLGASAAPVGEVQQFDLGSGQIAVKLSSNKVKPGDVLILSFSDKRQCSMLVKEVRNEVAMAQLSRCPQDEKIRLGQEVEDSLFESTDQQGADVNRSAPPMPSTPTTNESWYTLWGLGFANVSYEGNTKAVASALDSYATIENSTFSMDLLGFYWPLSGHQTMLGFIINVASDIWTDSTGSFSINQYLYGFSAHHFFGANIGDGWFVRGDIGISKYAIVLDTNIGSDSADSDTGFGALLGGGYAFPIGSETRMLVNLNYSHRSADSEKMGTTALSLGFLF